MTFPQTPGSSPRPPRGLPGQALEADPSNRLQEGGSSPRPVSEGTVVVLGEGEAPGATAVPTLTAVEYAVRYTAPEAFAGTVAHIRHHKSSAAAMARSENDHPQHPDIRCHVVTRTVTYGEWTSIEHESC